MKREVYKLIPKSWHNQIQDFTENEFDSIVMIDGKKVKKTSNDLHKEYNQDEFAPRDGELIKVADHLSAYIEAYTSLRHYVSSSYLQDAIVELHIQYTTEKSNVAGIDFGAIYAEYEKQHQQPGLETFTPLHDAYSRLRKIQEEKLSP